MVDRTADFIAEQAAEAIMNAHLPKIVEMVRNDIKENGLEALTPELVSDHLVFSIWVLKVVSFRCLVRNKSADILAKTPTSTNLRRKTCYQTHYPLNKPTGLV